MKPLWTGWFAGTEEPTTMHLKTACEPEFEPESYEQDDRKTERTQEPALVAENESGR